MIDQNQNRGFTLVEMLIAIGLFIVVVTISMGALLSIFDANRKARTSKSVVDNLNFTIENMARTVRFGTKYHCGETGVISDPLNCPHGGSGSNFLAVEFESTLVSYRLDTVNRRIQRRDGPTTNPWRDITPDEVEITNLTYYVTGAGTGDISQPYVTAIVRGYVGTKSNTQSNFSIETTMSQRVLDI